MRSTLFFPLLAAAVSLAAPIAPRAEDDTFASQVSKGLRLVSLQKGEPPAWITREKKLELARADVHFIDVTNVWEKDSARAAERKPKTKATYPDPSHQEEVTALLGKLDITQQKADLKTLSDFNNRYSESETGQDASVWIQNTLKEIASGRDDVTVTAVKHSFVQTSTVARIEGADPAGAVTIIGGHMDSVNWQAASQITSRAPGADDDGSGSVNIIDVFRVLVGSDFKPSTPVEFHFYAGEEDGLLGSQDIASQYDSDGVEVRAMVQLDMTLYPGTAGAIVLMTDNTDAGLNAFLKKIATAYNSIKVEEDKCGYGCSDHASWDKYSFPASMPFEARMGDDNPRIHTAQDTIDQAGLDWDHSLEFAKLGLAAIYELAV